MTNNISWTTHQTILLGQTPSRDKYLYLWQDSQLQLHPRILRGLVDAGELVLKWALFTHQQDIDSILTATTGCCGYFFGRESQSPRPITYATHKGDKKHLWWQLIYCGWCIVPKEIHWSLPGSMSCFEVHLVLLFADHGTYLFYIVCVKYVKGLLSK